MTITHRFTVLEIRQKLSSDPVWAARAITALYKRQTHDEQVTQDTRHHNDMGFTSADARILSSFAEQIHRGRTLSPKQLAIAYRKLPKYAKQLWEIGQAQAPEKVSQKPGPRGSTKTASCAMTPLQRSMVFGEDPAEVRDQHVIDLYWKDQFAQREQAQERMAFLSDPDFREAQADEEAEYHARQQGVL